MFLLSLHQIFQHCLPKFQTISLLPFPFNHYCRGGGGDITHPMSKLRWPSADNLGNEHTHSQPPNSAGLETSTTQILLHLSNFWVNYLQTRPVLPGSTVASSQRHKSAITCQNYDKRPGVAGCHFCHSPKKGDWIEPSVMILQVL